ncbi:MAG: 3-hydroxybutyryl-CoA dehydrogenase [Spirochaetaceae bacterium]|jgi:3-hydroxybutyryl-CoA dehydrogenase|nr:3-hydroxybutyryl-CoA dehydrogenase [Spirochaetaceae bacterium]
MKVAVVGAGTMGSGIAQAFAAAGNEVFLTDISLDFAQGGLAKIQKKLEKSVSKGKIDAATKDAILGRIKAVEKKDIGSVDLVEEAAIEDMKAKQDLFRSLEPIVGKDTIFATNTSSLSITEIDKGLDRPVVGMHFFNPADVMALVEVIAGVNTPATIVDKIIEIAKSIGKTPVRVAEAPGFVVNRILIPMINEAIGIYAEHIASAEDIDTAMKLGANHPMGPLSLGDLIGLDVVLAIMDVLYHETGDSKYRAHILLRKMVRGGLLGRKTGRGFFEYNK